MGYIRVSTQEHDMTPNDKPAEFAVMCAWCGRVKVDDAYVEAPAPKGVVSHGICADCAAREFGQAVA